MPRLAEAAVVVAFAVLTLGLYGRTLNITPLSVPVYLVLTILFITTGSVLVALISARAYLRSRLPAMLLLGSGALLFGLTSLIAAAAALMAGRYGSNAATTIFVVGISMSALAYLASLALRSLGGKGQRGAVAHVAVAFGAVLALTGLLTIAALKGSLPVFLIPGAGMTSVSGWTLAAATGGMALAAGVIAKPAFKSTVLCWYCSALAMTAVGMLGLLLSNWDFEAADFVLGRAALSVAGLFMVLSVIAADRQSADTDAAVKQIFNPP